MVVTVIVVFDSLGYCLIGSPSIARSPISRIRRLTTSASTGRRMKMSVNDTGVAEKSVQRGVGRRLRRRRAGDRDLRAALQLNLTGGDDLLAGFQPAEYRHVIVPPCSGLDRGAHHLEDRLPLSVFE